MINAEKLAAFALISGTISLTPGPSMLYVMGQAIWRGLMSGVAALAGLQLGYVFWWMLAALGLGTLAVRFPLAFQILAFGGALYLAWLGVNAFRGGKAADQERKPFRQPAGRAFSGGVVVAIGNPKALIYIVAVLPPFVETNEAIVPQLLALAVVAILIDVAVGALYIATGTRLARVMNHSRTRLWVGRTVGVIFIGIAIALAADLLLRTRPP